MSVFRNTDCLSLVVCSNTTLLKLQTLLFLFFSKFCTSKAGVRLIYGCGLYTDIYGIANINYRLHSFGLVSLSCISVVSILAMKKKPKWGFTAQKRSKSDVRSSLHMSTTENLICINTEGPVLEALDPIPAVVTWFSSGQRSRRPNFAYRRWPDELISVADSWDSPDFE